MSSSSAVWFHSNVAGITHVSNWLSLSLSLFPDFLNMEIETEIFK